MPSLRAVAWTAGVTAQDRKLVRHKERVPRAGYGVVDRDFERRGAGVDGDRGDDWRLGSSSGSGPGADVQ